MTPMLVNLEIAYPAVITDRSGDTVRSETVISTSRLRAHFIVQPQHGGLGFVQVHVDCEPTALPQQTPDQMRAWLSAQLAAAFQSGD